MYIGASTQQIDLGERSAQTYSAKGLFDSGANVTFSSDDWTPNVLSPFLGMQLGHHRRFPDEWLAERRSDSSLPPESEKLGLDLMLKGYTINGAYPFRLEDQIGSIESGKLADLVVLEESLFDMNPAEIYKIKPLAVMMEGAFIRGEVPTNQGQSKATP